ncbi:MAG: hypothetical protein ACO35B_09885 [Luminiphilus sp.]
MPVEEATPSATRKPLAFAVGVGGSVTLFEKELLIVRNGWVNHLLRWVSGATPRIERTIPLRHISGVAIVKPLLLNEYFLIAYPGAPPATGYQLHDAISENAVMMNFFDNRAFYRLKDKLDTLLDYK